MKHTIYCQLQNRLGALDKVISTLTLVGILPEELKVTQDTEAECQHMIITFLCADEAATCRLIKALERQIYVIEVNSLVGNDPLPFQYPTSRTVKESTYA